MSNDWKVVEQFTRGEVAVTIRLAVHPSFVFVEALMPDNVGPPRSEFSPLCVWVDEPQPRWPWEKRTPLEARIKAAIDQVRLVGIQEADRANRVLETVAAVIR